MSEEELHDGETKVRNPETGELIVFTSREWTADLLEKVARLVRVGHFPDDVKAFDLGRALGRALCNSTEESPDLRLIAGLLHWHENNG